MPRRGSRAISTPGLGTEPDEGHLAAPIEATRRHEAGLTALGQNEMVHIDYTTIFTDAGSAAAVGGVAVALNAFSTRLTLDLSAETYEHEDRSVFIAACSRVKCVGLLRVDLSRLNAATVEVDQLSSSDDDENVNVEQIQSPFAVFEGQKVLPGEELVTERLLPVGIPASDVIG